MFVAHDKSTLQNVLLVSAKVSRGRRHPGPELEEEPLVAWSPLTRKD